MLSFIKYSWILILFAACASSNLEPSKELSKVPPQSEYRTELVTPTGVGYYVDFYDRISDDEISWKDKGFYILFDKDDQKKIGFIPLDSNKIRIYKFLNFPSWDIGYPDIGLCVGESYTSQEYENFFMDKCRKEYSIDSMDYRLVMSYFSEKKMSIKKRGIPPRECVGETLNIIYYDGNEYQYFDMISPKCFDSALRNNPESFEYKLFYEKIDGIMDGDFQECRWDKFLDSDVVEKCVSKYR